LYACLLCNANDGLAHSTIKVYLSVLCNFHVATGYYHIFTGQLPPRLEQVLRGIKKTQASQLMRWFKTALPQEVRHYDNILFWAACCKAFFGFLRCSEFPVPSMQDYNPSVHHSYEDLLIGARNSPSVVQVHIKQSKTNQGVQLCLG